MDSEAEKRDAVSIEVGLFPCPCGWFWQWISVTDHCAESTSEVRAPEGAHSWLGTHTGSELLGGTGRLRGAHFHYFRLQKTQRAGQILEFRPGSS